MAKSFSSLIDENRGKLIVDLIDIIKEMLTKRRIKTKLKLL